MDGKRIFELTEYLPENCTYFSSLGGLGASSKVKDPAGYKVARFLVSYRDLRFGSHFVKQLVRSKQQLPFTVREPHLMDAYFFEKTGKGPAHIVQAYAYAHPSSTFFSALLEGLLLSDDFDLSKASEDTGIPEEVIDAYEKLFFNIRDRKKEAAFIASVVYPQSRVVEMYEDYTNSTPSGQLIRRAGYNHGMIDTLYLSGLKTGRLSGESSADMTMKLESSIMANGYYLARSGFINTRAAGLQSARSLIVAAKQSGQEVTEDDATGLGSMGQVLSEAYAQFSEPKIRKILEARKKLYETPS